MLEGLSITEMRRSIAMLRNGSYGGKQKQRRFHPRVTEIQQFTKTGSGQTQAKPSSRNDPALLSVCSRIAGGGQLGMFLASGKRKHRSAKDDRFFWIGNQQGKGKAVSKPKLSGR
eukprot:COSAG06_NODE_8052_length_2287_cov_12.388026_2_plen_115_part_00